MEQLIRNHPIMAILRNVPLENTIDYADAAFQGGIRAFEIAMNSKEALKQIELLRDRYGDTAEVGAGTAISIQRASDAVSAGASFLLTPSSNRDVLGYCREHAIRLLPGVMTPTDVDTCVNFGFYTLKLFPAGDLPAKYIKSLQGPFDDTNYVAVGGVSLDNAQSFFDRGFVGVGIGSNLIPAQYTKENRWEEAAAYIRGQVEKITVHVK